MPVVDFAAISFGCGGWTSAEIELTAWAYRRFERKLEEQNRVIILAIKSK